MAANMDALLKIRAEVDGANNIVSLNRGLQSVEGTAKGVTTAMRGMTGAAAGLSGALGALTPLLSVAGLVGLAKGALDAGDRMNDLAQSTGVSVESLAKFKKAAATSGTDIDGVAKALVKLSKGMLEANAGNKQASAAFKALGVSITDSKGNLKASDEVMLQVANRFKAMPDGVAKTALSLKLFGKAGAEMIPLLNMGGDAIDKLSSKMTTAFAKKADEYKDKLALLSGKVGALGQDLFIALLPALTSITDAVTKGVEAFNKLPEPAKNFALSGAAIAIAWGPALSLIRGAIGAFALLTTAQVSAGAAAAASVPQYAAASGAMTGAAVAGSRLIAALTRLAAIGIITVGVNYISNVVGAGMTIRQLQERDRRGGAAADFQGATRQQVIEAQEKQRENLENLRRQDEQRRKDIAGNPLAGLAALFGAAPFMAAEQQGINYKAKYAQGVLGLDPSKFRDGSKALAGFNPDLSALEEGGKAKKESDKAARLAEQRRKQLADADKLLAIENGRLEVSAAANELEKIQAEYDKTQVERRVKFLALQKGALSDQARAVYAEAQFRAIQADRLDYNAKIQKLMQDQTRELYNQVGLARVLDKELQRSIGSAFSGSTGTGTFRTDVDLMPGLTGGELGAKIEELKKSLADLQDPIKQVMAGAQAMGQAFSNSFKGLIDGSMTAQQAMAGFFKSIANHFLDMASQMIAKYIEMQIIGLASKFLPGFGSAFGPGGAPDFSGSAISVPNQYSYGGGSSILGSANGNVFAQNGIVPYAMGGIVDRPTLFPFAKGIGLMGEAGPEAIMPLKRGADGKLGVAGGGRGGTTVNVSVDAKGTSVAGDGGNSAALGRAIAASVQQELIKQKRPGGLLA
jgi:hypothetical protein